MYVPGEGAIPSRIIFCGEGPGVEEERRGRSWVGKAGDVLWQFTFRACSLTREEVYVTNLSKERLTNPKGKDRPPTKAEFEELAPLLRAEVKKVDPEFIVTFGRFSTAALLRQFLPMDVVNGHGFYTKKKRVVIPVFHPAAGLHQPEMLPKTAWGLSRANKIIRGIIRPKYLMHGEPKTIYSVLTNGKLHDDPYFIPYIIGMDTEYDPETGEPWCLTYSPKKGVAYLIRATDTKTLAAFRIWLRRYKPLVNLHHALTDIPPLRAMGIDLWELGCKVTDSMEDLFLMQTEPQKLKVAAHRWLGVKMREYEDVVEPVVEEFAIDYFERCLAPDSPLWKKKKGDRKQTPAQRITNLLKPAKKTMMQKWKDKKFRPMKDLIEAIMGTMPRPKMKDVEASIGDEFIEYACRDADVTRRLTGKTVKRLKRENLMMVRRIDLGAYPLIERMQTVGMKVSRKKLAAIETKLDVEIPEIIEQCREISGEADLNPGSDAQVAKICQRLKLHLTRMTKSKARLTVDENSLKMVQLEHPFPAKVLEYRRARGLKSKIESLWEFIKPDNRLYPNLRTTSVVTGRLSAYDPNSLALDRRLREIFIAGKGRRIGSLDLSQIELRVGAGLSQDPNMMQAFIDGKDLHAWAASILFDVPEEEVDPVTQRLPTKTLNFMVFYGGGPDRAEREFASAGIKGWPRKRCEEFIHRWHHELFIHVHKWLRRQISEGLRYGFVRTEAGRIRYLPGLALMGEKFEYIRAEAERQAGNFPVQGTAQEVIKRAMPIIHTEVLPAVRAAGFHAEPLLQIHDEILFEYDEGAEEMISELALEAMVRESPFMGVPLKANWSSGHSWGDIKK